MMSGLFWMARQEMAGEQFKIFHLYIKQHEDTKLKYFGFTIQKNPFKYKGSGQHWTNHMKMHGPEKVKTLSLFSFNTHAEAKEFAIDFSNKNSIVESKDWANMIIENCEQGYNPNRGPLAPQKPTSQETKDQISRTLKAKNNGLGPGPTVTSFKPGHTPANKNKTIEEFHGEERALEIKAKQRLMKLGRPSNSSSKFKKGDGFYFITDEITNIKIMGDFISAPIGWRRGRKDKNPIPISTPFGKFNSVSEASRVTNIRSDYINIKIKSSDAKYSNWHFINEEVS